MLQPLGMSQLDEEVFVALVMRPHQSVVDLTRELGLRSTAVSAAVHRLEELGFLSRLAGSPARLVATRPDVAVSALIERRTTEFAEARLAAEELTRRTSGEQRTSPDQLVEIVLGRDAVGARFVQLAHSVQEEMLVLDRPPYVQAASQPNVSEDALLGRGGRVRGIYAPEAFEQPGALEQALAAMAHGEQARVHTDVPLKLAVGDRAVALLPLATDGVVDSAVVIHAPMAVAALVRLFELLWDQACPLPQWERGKPASPAGELDVELLVLLATGMKDEAIARELGISLRTLGRRMATLLERLGARTRFQAGMQAARNRLA
ncbi:MAG TPA: helix-turn-helix domain-containing protein [Jatrophihabitans sp.]|nr:helix-turn-helix domain-containing protein [Jatrophihabitans sp.]